MRLSVLRKGRERLWFLGRQLWTEAHPPGSEVALPPSLSLSLFEVLLVRKSLRDHA